MISMENEDNGDSLDIYLAKATNPLIKEIDSNIKDGLCEAINQTSDGPQIALRFLAHKIQSPQEREALHALSVLEMLMQCCGHRFIDEVAKFRFLNEIIKVVSPKYLAHRSSPIVKQRVIELMFLWSIQIKEMPKIFEAYQMLKKQGIVSEDPVHVLPNYKPPTPPPPRPKDEIFDDEENAKQLRALLQTGKQEDLLAANRLIKSMAKEADKRMDLKARFQSELETVNNNAKVLTEMIAHYSPNESSAEEKELMKELFESCERLRFRLFKLASDLNDKDPNMSRLLTANDELTKAINLYKDTMNIVSDESTQINTSLTNSFSNLLDLASASQQCVSSSNDVALLDDHFAFLSTVNEPDINCENSVSSHNYELGEIFLETSTETKCNGENLVTTSNILLPEPIKPQNFKINEDNSKNLKTGPMTAFDELNALSQSLMKQNLVTDKSILYPNNDVSKVSLNELQQLKTNSSQITQINSTTSKQLEKTENSSAFHSLTDVFISLESIEPSNTPPLTLYDKNNIKIILHFAKNSPLPEVNVMVITIMSTNLLKVSQINFLAAVPKSMKVKLQPRSANTLPAYSPFLPPSAITQIMLIYRGNAHQSEKVRLKYKFSYVIDTETFSDVGEIDSLLENYQS